METVESLKITLAMSAYIFILGLYFPENLFTEL